MHKSAVERPGTFHGLDFTAKAVYRNENGEGMLKIKYLGTDPAQAEAEFAYVSQVIAALKQDPPLFPDNMGSPAMGAGQMYGQTNNFPPYGGGTI